MFLLVINKLCSVYKAPESQNIFIFAPQILNSLHMDKPSQPKSRVISFARWSRKSYAVFSSLGKVIRISVLCLVSSILVLPCRAQENRDTLQKPETLSGHELDEVVVSAQLSPVVQSQLMRVVQVISRAEIEQSPVRDLAGLLESIRGIDIRKRGTFGMQADVSIRGGTFDQTLILLNGINITDPQTGHHNLNVPVDAHSIERIEVLQGAGARIFGPNAFNGAVNIITKEPGPGNVHASLSGGEYGFGQAGLTAGFRSGPIRHFISAGGMTSDGFTENTDFKTGTIFYRNTTEIGKSRLDAQAGYNQKAFGANSFYTPRFPNQFEATRTGFASLQWNPGGRIQIKPTVYWRRHHDRFELFRDNAPAWYTRHNYHLTDVAGASLNWSNTGTLGTSSFGLDYRYEHIYSNVLGKPMEKQKAVQGYEDAFFSHSYNRSGLSLMAEHTVYAGNFSASAGLLTYLNTDLDDGVSFFPGLDLGWEFLPRWRWFASANRTLRLPTFTDLFYSGPGNIGNPLLTPEEAVSLETGIKSRWLGMDMEMAVFQRWGTNMIDWIKEPGEEQWKSMNLTEVTIRGLEAGIMVPLGNQLPGQLLRPSVSVQYSYISSGKSSGDFVSNYALDHLRHKLNVGFTHAITSKGGATYRVAWQQRTGGFMLYKDGIFQDLQDFEPYWMVDARLFYKFGLITLFTEASNVFDTQQVSISNVPQPGRWIRMGINADF
jgi:vitamin B12 transporter